jgi:transposase
VHLVLTTRAENYLHDRPDLAGTIARLQAYQGDAPASGSGCTSCCSTNSAATVGWTGRGPAWTRAACAPSGGLPDRPAAGGRGGCGRAGQGLQGRPGRPRKRPDKLHLDKGYDYPHCRRALRRRRITPKIARRGIEPRDRLGRYRYVVERSLAWLVGYRRLQVRSERRADILLGLLQLACALICLKFLNTPAGWRKPPTEAGDALSAPSR